LNRYIMFVRGICEKYQSRDETFPEPKGEGNLVSRLVFNMNEINRKYENTRKIHRLLTNQNSGFLYKVQL